MHDRVSLLRNAVWTAFAIMVASVSPASARIQALERSLCPVTGASVTFHGATTGTAFGTTLDLMPYGAVTEPWPMAVCPDASRFPVFKQPFTATERTAIRALVATPEWKALATGGNTPYYLVARAQRMLGYGDDEVASSLLRATWEATGDLLQRYRQEARDAYAKLASDLSRSPRQQAVSRWLDIDLSRLLGDFTAAEAGVRLWRSSTHWEAANITPSMLAQEMDLIEHRSAERRRVGEVR